MTIVWACAVSAEEYLSAGAKVEVPRPDCPSCSKPMVFWSGYWRDLRAEGRCAKAWVRRARCKDCGVSHGLLPAFLLVGRLDVVESVGEVLEAVMAKMSGVRPAAARVEVPYTTARGWRRRFERTAERWAVAFSALAVELGGAVLTPLADAGGRALEAIRAAWEAATALPGWAALGAWRFASAVSGGRLIATNTDSPWLIVGRRRFMPPVP